MTAETFCGSIDDDGDRPMRDIALWTSEALDITAFAVILIAVAVSTAVFVVRVWQSGFLANYREYRANLGRGILVGLEILIAADILKSVVVDPTLQGILVLGGIVVIRTFLSISLDVEINGHWPWDTTRLTAQENAAQRPAGPA
jgi:uncharacterized membrane protein